MLKMVMKQSKLFQFLIEDIIFPSEKKLDLINNFAIYHNECMNAIVPYNFPVETVK